MARRFASPCLPREIKRHQGNLPTTGCRDIDTNCSRKDSVPEQHIQRNVRIDKGMCPERIASAGEERDVPEIGFGAK